MIRDNMDVAAAVPVKDGYAKAKMIRDNMDVAAAVPVKDGYAKVYHAFQSLYPCLQITCADVGGLLSNAPATYPFAGQCDDAKVKDAFKPDTSKCPDTKKPAGGDDNKKVAGAVR